MSIIIEISMIIDPKLTINLVTDDPSDNRILECVLAAECDYIITGDKHLLKIKHFYGVSIVTPDGFLKMI